MVYTAKSSLGGRRSIRIKAFYSLAAAALGSIIMLACAVTLLNSNVTFSVHSDDEGLSVLSVILNDLFSRFPQSPSAALNIASVTLFFVGLCLLTGGTAITLALYMQNRGMKVSQSTCHSHAASDMAALNAVHAIFDFVSLLVPRRLANEELGDALEVIDREIAKRRPRWRVWLKIGTTLFWITINSLRWARGSFRGRRRFR